MKGIIKKINKGEPAYYFELFALTPEGKKGVSRYIGKRFPAPGPEREELAKKIIGYCEEFSEIISELTSQKIRDYFKYTDIKDLERLRFYYSGLTHELNKSKLERFQTIFMILFVLNSARAEGSRMVEEDLKISVQKNKGKTMEQKEALNTLMAIKWAFSPNFTWSTLSIRKLHRMIFHDIEPEVAGQYKQANNVVGQNIYGQIIETTPYDAVSAEMQSWVAGIKYNLSKAYPPILALESHLKFESIHPFHDGNGRIGRILLNRILLEQGFMPTIFFEENHEAYCNGIAAAREGRKDKYIKLFVKQMKKTREIFEEHEFDKELVSKRKGLAISWELQRGRQAFNFKTLNKEAFKI